MKKKRNRFYSIKQKREKIAILFFALNTLTTLSLLHSPVGFEIMNNRVNKLN